MRIKPNEIQEQVGKNVIQDIKANKVRESKEAIFNRANLDLWEQEMTKIKRKEKLQKAIAKTHNIPTGPEHRLAKVHATTCGDSNCVMCGNPRKFFKEKTIQEKRAEQRAKDE